MQPLNGPTLLKKVSTTESSMEIFDFYSRTVVCTNLAAAEHKPLTEMKKYLNWFPSLHSNSSLIAYYFKRTLL